MWGGGNSRLRGGSRAPAGRAAEGRACGERELGWQRLPLGRVRRRDTLALSWLEGGRAGEAHAGLQPPAWVKKKK